MRRSRKTRNQRRRDRIETIITGFVVFAMSFAVCLLLCGMFCKTWGEHPAELPVQGREYIEMVQKCGDDHVIQNR